MIFFAKVNKDSLKAAYFLAFNFIFLYYLNSTMPTWKSLYA